MKKVISTIIIVILSLLLYSTAYAATMEIVTEPAELVSAGSITIKFSVTNDSAKNMSNMTIRGYGIADNDNSLASYEIVPLQSIIFYKRNVSITADMLGTPITYTFSWVEGGEARSLQKSITLGTGTTQPVQTAIEASRTASKKSGKEGDKVTLTYTLKNPTTLAMTDISIKDPIAGSTTIKTGLSLDPGATRTETYEYTIQSQEATSQPTITYKINGEEKSVTLDKLAISIVNLNIQTTVTVGEQTADGVLFTIALKNTGNQTVDKIKITDELGNAVNTDSFTLQAGNENVLSFMVKTETLRVVSFTIKGTDQSGQPYEDKTQNYDVYPFIDPSNVSLQLVAQIVENLNEDGNVKIRFVIQNNSQVEIKNTVIREAQLGEVASLTDVLPLGETTQEKILKIGEPRELEFVLSAYDPSGTEHMYTSKVTALIVATPTPPLESATPTDDEQDEKGANNTLVTILIVLAVLMAIAGVALLILSIYERKRNAEYDTINSNARDPRGGSRRQQTPESRGSSKRNKGSIIENHQPAVEKRAHNPNPERPIRGPESMRTQPPQSPQTGFNPAQRAPRYDYDRPQQPGSSDLQNGAAPRQATPVNRPQPQSYNPGANYTQAPYREQPVNTGGYEQGKEPYNDMRFAQPPQYTPPAPLGVNPSQQGYAPLEPPVVAPNQYDGIEQDDNTTLQDGSRAQASLGVRNKVHRVRPVDEDKN